MIKRNERGQWHGYIVLYFDKFYQRCNYKNGNPDGLSEFYIDDNIV